MAFEITLPESVLNYIKKMTESNCMMSERKLLAAVKGLYFSRPQNSEKVIELGTYIGKTSATLAYSLDVMGVDCSVIAVDNFVVGKEWEATWYKNNTSPRATLVVGPTLEFLKSYNERNIAFLIIDAGHEYDDTKSDIINSVDKVRSGGVIYVDDYNGWSYPGVLKAVNELMLKNPQYKLLELTSLYIIFQKI
jgi:predicted O-methyltransferase YrrM